MDTEYSPWFSGLVQPARVGVYYREVIETTRWVYSYYDGYHWYVGGSTPDLATTFYKRRERSTIDVSRIQWRGLANESESN